MHERQGFAKLPTCSSALNQRIPCLGSHSLPNPMSQARSPLAALVRTFAPVALLCAFACALCISTYSVYSHTWDEPEHLAAGVAFLDTGNYPYDQQHPPLARIAMALGPIAAGAHSYGNPGPSGEQEGREILYN